MLGLCVSMAKLPVARKAATFGRVGRQGPLTHHDNAERPVAASSLLAVGFAIFIEGVIQQLLRLTVGLVD